MREIRFRCYILDKTGRVEAYFHEWLDGDGWKHDYYSPLVSSGVFSHEELGDGFFGEIVRAQFIGLKDEDGNDFYDGDIIDDGDSLLVIRWTNENYDGVWTYHPLTKDGNPLNRYYGGWSAGDEKKVGNIYENPELLIK